MSNPSSDIVHPAFTFWDRSLGKTRTDEGLPCDSPHVLKLQAPPKNKFKRQLSTESDTQSSSEAFTVRNTRLRCTDVMDSDRSHVRPDYRQLQEAVVGHHHKSIPSSSSLLSPSTFSPKKFKSVLEPVSPLSWDQTANRSPRNVLVAPNITSQKTEEPVAKCPLILAGNSRHLTGWGNSQLPQVETHLPGSDNAPTMTDDTGNKGNSRIKMNQRKGNVSESPVLGCEWNVKNNRRICEPDIFLFPEAGSVTSILPQQKDEPDGMDDPMDTNESCFREHYQNLAKGGHVYHSVELQLGFTMPSFQRTLLNEPRISNVHKNLAASQPQFSGKTCTHRSNYDSLTSCHVRNSEQRSINWDENVSFSAATNKQENLTSSMDQTFLPATQKGLIPVRCRNSDHITESLFNLPSKVRTTDIRHFSQGHHNMIDVLGQSKGETTQHHARPSSCSAIDILDNSNLDEGAYYLEEEVDLSCHMFGSKTIRRYDVDRTFNGREDTSAESHSGDSPLNTRADTNVYYISLNDSDSSMSTDDIEQDCDINNDTTFKLVGHNSYSDDDYLDETDGRGRKLSHNQESRHTSYRQITLHTPKLEPANRSIYDFCQSVSADRTTPGNEIKDNVYRTDHCPIAKSTRDQAPRTRDVLFTSGWTPPAKSLPRFTTDSIGPSCILLSEECSFQKCNSSKSPRMLEENRNLQQFFPTHSKLQASTKSRHVMDCKQYRAGAWNSVSGHGDVATRWTDDEYYKDEVDGLGDKARKCPKSTKNVISKQGQIERSETKNIVSCFDENTANLQQPMPEQPCPEGGSQCTLSDIDTQDKQYKLSAAQVCKPGPSQHEAVYPLSQVLNNGRCVLMDKGSDLRAETTFGQNRVAIDARICRRKSDTSIEGATETCISRSQSSPSKLDLTTGNYPEKTRHTFHRPWLEQPSHGTHTLPRTQKANISSAHERRTYTINLGHMNLPSYDFGSCPRKYASQNISRPTGSSSKEDCEGFQEDECNRTSLSPRMSADSNKLGLQQIERLTEARPKRKLEFSPQSWNHELAKRESCLVRCNVEAVSGGMVDTGSTTPFGNSSSSICSHQQIVCSRSDDEVDVRIQVLDVFQETTNLRHRMDTISQESDRGCECSRIEQNILTVTLSLFRTLGSETSSRENWLSEIRNTNQMIKDSLDLADNCRRLCRHGRQVTDVFPGSIIIRMKCRTLTSMVDLCHLHATGELHEIFFNLLKWHLTAGLTLRVTLDRDSVQVCQNYFVSQVSRCGKTRPSAAIRTPIQKELGAVARGTDDLLIYSPVNQASPGLVTQETRSSTVRRTSISLPIDALTSCRERKFSMCDVNRTAFQELNISDAGLPSSPSYIRYFRDENHQALGKSDLTLTQPQQLNGPNILTSPRLIKSPVSSPLTSPRKLKLCDVISEQENIGQESD